MPRRRHSRKYAISRPLKTTKYSNETYAVSMSPISEVASKASDIKILIPPTSGILGTRKCKNFTLRLHFSEPLILDSSGVPTGNLYTSPILFALVYVPEGTSPTPPAIGTVNAASLYEPNQNVILSGLVDTHQVYSFKTRLARNLNSGDSIVIIASNVANAASQQKITFSLCATCNYAIAF